MRYLSLGQVVELHRRLIEASGGAAGIRDLGALESAVAAMHPESSQSGIRLLSRQQVVGHRSDGVVATETFKERAVAHDSTSLRLNASARVGRLIAQ